MTSSTVVEMQLSELLELYTATNNDFKQELRLAYNPSGFRFVNVTGTRAWNGELTSVTYGVLDVTNNLTTTYTRPPHYNLRVNIPDPPAEPELPAPPIESETPVIFPRATVIAAIRPDSQAIILDSPKVDGWSAKVNVTLPGVSIQKERFFITEDEAEDFATSEGEKYDQLYNYPKNEASWETIYSNVPEPEDEFL